METQPYGSKDNWFYKAQETLIPTKHHGLPQSYALECIQRISYHTKQEGTYHWVMARVNAATLPFFVSASVLQLGGVVFADITVSLLGHTHYHYTVSKTNSCSLDHVSIQEELKELIYHVVAIFTTIIVWLPSVTVAPGIYHRKEPEARPKTEQETAVDVAQRVIQAEATVRRVTQEMTKRERGAFLTTYPLITPENFDQLSAVEFQGIQLRRITYEKPRFVSNTRGRAEERPEYSQGCWTSEDEFFDRDRTRYFDVPIDNPELYFTPSLDETRQVMIDCRYVSPEELQLFLSKAHNIHALHLIGAPINTLLEDLPGLRSIQRLIFRPKNDREVFKATDLSALGERYPNIKVFDLDQCKVDGENREFSQRHIVISPTYTNRVGHVQAPGLSNLTDQHNDFNRATFEFVQSYDPSAEEEVFEVALRRLLAHPAAAFLTKFDAFKGTQLRTHHAKILLKCLRESCPYLEVLDFRNCYMLDSEIFTALADCKIKHLYLQGCNYIYYRRPVEDDREFDLVETLEKPDLERKERKYVLNMHVVTYGLNRLFDNGIERVRLNQVGVGHTKQEEIRKAIFSGVYPIIAKWANPRSPHCRDVKIYYLNDQSFNGVPLAR